MNSHEPLTPPTHESNSPPSEKNIAMSPDFSFPNVFTLPFDEDELQSNAPSLTEESEKEYSPSNPWFSYSQQTDDDTNSIVSASSSLSFSSTSQETSQPSQPPTNSYVTALSPPRSSATSSSIHHLPPQQNSKQNKFMPTLIQNGLKKISTSRTNVLRRLDRSRFSKKKKVVLKQLESSIKSVEDVLNDRLRILMKFKDLKKKHVKEMNVMLEKLETNALWNVFSVANSYYQNKLLYLDTEIEIAMFHCRCFGGKFKQLTKVGSRLKENVSSYEYDDIVLAVEAAMNTASNIRVPCEIDEMRKNADTLCEIVDELYLKMKEEEDKCQEEMSSFERQQHMMTILIRVIASQNEEKKDDGNVDKMYYHDVSCGDEHGDQMAFEQMLFDPRFEEGKIVQKWFEVVHKKNQSATVSDLSLFVKRLTSKICDSCVTIESEENDEFCSKFRLCECIYLMTSRSILNRMKGSVIYSESDDENDKIFGRRLEWMSRDLSPCDVDVNDVFGVDRESFLGVFGSCVDELMKLNDLMVGHDIVMVMVNSVKMMQKIASEKMRHVNGDVLFPIVVYCVVCCDGVKWHRVFRWLDEIMMENVMERGETGFCTSLVRAAMGFVMMQTREKYGLDGE